MNKRLLTAAVLATVMPAATLADNQEESKRSAEKRWSMTLDAPDQNQYCQARVSVEYTQRNTLASVTGSISNEDCGRSSGTYAIAVRYRNDDGEVFTDEYEEFWSRENDEAVTFEAEYPIPENVDLINLRPRKVRCVCVPDAEQTEEPEGETQ